MKQLSLSFIYKTKFKLIGKAQLFCDIITLLTIKEPDCKLGIGYFEQKQKSVRVGKKHNNI